MDSFEYYLIDDYGLDSSPLLIEDEEEDQSAWFLIEETPVEIEVPVKLCFNEPIPRKPKMVDYHSMPDSVVSKKIYDALVPLDIFGIQLIPASIRDSKTGKTYIDYFVIHVYNQILCLDMEESEYSISKVTGKIKEIDKLVLDKKILASIPLGQRLVFLLKEDISKRVYHKSVVDAIMATNPEGVVFDKIEDWYEGIQFQR